MATSFRLIRLRFLTNWLGRGEDPDRSTHVDDKNERGGWQRTAMFNFNLGITVGVTFGAGIASAICC